MKIPDPIIDPTTREMAARGPIPRMNSEGAEVWAGAFAGATIEYPGAVGVILNAVKHLSGYELRDSSLRSE